MIEIDKSKMYDSQGRAYTQSLFLEIKYDENVAIYTLKNDDYIFKGKKFYSLKKLYLEECDPTEYLFVEKYLTSWDHWLKICDNMALNKHITDWRKELEYKLKSLAAKKMIDQAKQGNFQAAKWLSDKGWAEKVAGRPSKLDIENKIATDRRVISEYGDDIARLLNK